MHFLARERERVMAELVPVLLELARLAKSHELQFTIDAEEADRLELSIEVIGAMVSPAASFGTRKRLTPSSIVLPSRVRAATTRMSAKCASETKSFMPDRENPPRIGWALVVMPDASQREGWLARVRADPGRAQERPRRS